MKRISKFIRLALLIAISVPFLSSCGYNKVMGLEEDVKAQWAQVENVYQRRADLIPNLVEVVKGYAAHEKETLEAVINARAKATGVNINADNLNAQTLQNFQAAQQGLTSALSKLMVVVEKYPDLKANQNFRDLQVQLEGTENRIAVERKKYTAVVGRYNKAVRKFPRVMWMGWFGFEPMEQFSAEEGSDKAPEVKF